MLWYRLRNDFPLAVLTLIAMCAAFGITPFAIYRFASGNPVAGVIDLGMVLIIGGAVVHAWRSGNTGIAAWICSVSATIGCTAIAILMGLPGLFWMYAAVLANSLLLPPRPALLLIGAAVAVVTLHGGAFDTTLQVTMFLVSISTVAMFAFIFAYRSEQQRVQLEILARHDPLTGAANRRSMEEELALAIEMSRRERRPYGLAILDLDHFKRINDRHGHAAGDQVLIDFVRMIRTGTRKIDRLFRYGGEEFVLLLPGADGAALHTVLGNLRMRIGESLQSRGEPVTVSIGAAALQTGEHWEAWLARADSALYQAKEQGRNRSVVADASPALSERDDYGMAVMPAAGPGSGQTSGNAKRRNYRI